MVKGAPPPAVAECLHAMAGDAWILEGVVARRDNSRIYRARSGSQTVAIKECLDPTTHAPDSAAADREWRALTQLANTAPQTGAHPLAPTPVLLCPGRGVYAMTWVPGRTATELVLSVATGLQQAAELGESCGAWLRRFHACKPLPWRQNDFAEKSDFVRQLGRGAGDREPMVRRVAGVLVERAERAASVPMPASWVHGDMKSDNLLLDADRTTGLDVQLVDENTAAYDLAPYLNHLYLLQWSPRGLRKRAQLNRMGEAFLRAYSPDAAQWTLPLLWLRGYLLLQIVARAALSKSWRTWAAKWPARRELALAIEKLEACR